MAQLPPDGEWLMQQIGEEVIIFRRYTEEEIVRFYPGVADSVAKAQKVIYDSALTDEQKCFAHMWSGYFYAYAGGRLGPISDFPSLGLNHDTDDGRS
jgi:hypothetical protein